MSEQTGEITVKIKWNPETKEIRVEYPEDTPLLHQLEFLLDLRPTTLKALRDLGETLLRQGF